MIDSRTSTPPRPVPGSAPISDAPVRPVPPPRTIEAVERSPFGAPAAGTRRRTLHVAASGALLLAAAAAAWLLRGGAQSEVAVATHNHGSAASTSTSAPVALGADAARRIGVTFAVATTGSMGAEVRTVGAVTYDETRQEAISPKIEGWVDKLFVDFTGREVREGEPLLSIYSPQLVAAQEELLLAARLVRDVSGGTPDSQRAAQDLLASARRRLQYWDIPASDIDRIERTGEVSRTLTLRSPARGVVVEKSVVAGQRIMMGETVYRVADLSTVWVEGEMFERDLAFVRLGTRAAVELQAYPGERWNGRVTYIYPTVDAETRAVRVRVELANPRLRLKPGMFATLLITGEPRAGVVSVPRSAVLVSGRRSIAFVRRADGMLEPREITTGVANDDRVEVLNGLQAGDTVVASATFLVDAESNLGAALDGMNGMPMPSAPPGKKGGE